MTIMQPQMPGIPLPSATPVSAPFWNGCLQRELLFQRCSSCRAALFNPAWMCRVCGSTALAWEASTGAGAVYSWTIAHVASSPDFKVPYAPAIVALDEGFHIISNIIGCTDKDIRVGLRVRVEFHDVGGGFMLPYFAPDSD